MKKILALILALVMTASLFVFVSCNKTEQPTEAPTEAPSDGTTLAGKTPAELFSATKTALEAVSDYTIKVSMVQSVNIADEPFEEGVYYEYTTKGNNAYTKYVAASEAVEERTYVDGIAYFSVKIFSSFSFRYRHSPRPRLVSNLISPKDIRSRWVILLSIASSIRLIW